MIKRLLIAVAMLCAVTHAQVPVTSIVQPRVTFVDAAGLPCAGCKLFTYAAGTTTPQATYTDATGTSQNTNPIILDAAGGAFIWLGANSYKLILNDALGAVIWSVDRVNAGQLLPCSSANAVQSANTAVNGLTCDPTITLNTLNHTINIGTLPSNHVTIGALGTPTLWNLDTTSPATALTSLGPTSVYANKFPGGDVGAQINAADTAAGTGPADIWVTVAGSVTTVPSISSNHRLILAAPLTWGGISPVLHNNTQIIGSGSNAVQTVSVMAQWITATSLTNLEIDNLWVTNTSVPTAEGSAILACLSCTGIIMNHNHGFGIGVLFTRSTAITYAAVNSGNLTQNVYLEGNYVDGNESGFPQASRVITLAFLQFAQNVTLVGNDIINGEYNVEWWGGNAAAEGLVLSNPRWAKNFSVVGGHATNVVSGWWGSMGINITVAGVTAEGCLDLCLDEESSSYVDFTGFTIHNGGPSPSSGALGVFFASQHITFGPGVVIEDTTAYQPIFVHNVSQNPTVEQYITFHDINFICNDPSNPCVMKFDAIGSLRFDDNTVVNCDMSFNSTNNSDYEISRNNFYMPISQVNSIIVIPGQVNLITGSSRIEGNYFNVNAYPAGSFAIKATITDANFPDQLFVTGNKTQGFTNDAQFIANSSNTSIAPTFIFSGNVWGGNSVTNTIAGNLGRFIGSTYNATTDSTVFTGPVGMGGLINGTGLQMISATGCTPPSSTLGQCTATVNLPIPVLNPGFVAVCNALGTNVLAGSVKNQTNTTFQVDIYATNTTSVSVNSVSCLVTHP